jgi:hypothetical protein
LTNPEEVIIEGKCTDLARIHIGVSQKLTASFLGEFGLYRAKVAAMSNWGGRVDK